MPDDEQAIRDRVASWLRASEAKDTETVLNPDVRRSDFPDRWWIIFI